MVRYYYILVDVNGILNINREILMVRFLASTRRY